MPQPHEKFPAWHKDPDHDLGRRSEHHGPPTVHIGMYFTDMTPEHGPIEVILGSHRDPARSPYAPDARPAHALIRKQDAFLWNQALWHRGTRRTIPGLRVFALEKVGPMAADVSAGWLETAYDRGLDIPLPSYPEKGSGTL